MDAPGKLIYKSRFPYVSIVIIPIVAIVFFIMIFLNDNEMSPVIIPVVAVVFIIAIILRDWAVVYIYKDRIEISYPARLFRRKHIVMASDIEKIIFDNTYTRRRLISFFFLTNRGKENFTHLFGWKERYRIIRSFNDLGIESYDNLDKY